MSSLPASNEPLNRREFLGASAKNAAGVAAGFVGWAGAAGAKASPGERVSVGVIGVRGQGKTLASEFASLPDVDIVALCDVDEGVLASAAIALQAEQGGASPCVAADFRRLLDDRTIDAVVIAVPDHWHALMTCMACQAGKDVYVEAPVTHTIREGAVMSAAVDLSGRVVQSGLQQRSGTHFQSAIAYIRSGGLGKVQLAKAWTVHQRKSLSGKAATAPPAGVNFDLWLGPAPKIAFHPNRFHYNWHWFWDYGSGELGNWGVHMLDVARWGLGVDLPTQVAATGGKHYFDDAQETPDTLFVQYSYPGSTITWEHRLWSAHAPEGRSTAAAFYGDRGTLIVDRGGWKVYGSRDAAVAEPTATLAPHLANFIDCVKTRRQPACTIAAASVSSALCHLGNIAHRLGRSVNFDPAGMNFGTDDAANSLLTCEYRSPWLLPPIG